MDDISLFMNSHILCRSFFVSILAGILSSFLFIFALLFLFRPRIRISPAISEYRLPSKSSSEPEKLRYFIKVINRSLFSAFDVKVELSLRTPFTGVRGAQNFKDEAVMLVKDEYPYFPRYIPGWVNGQNTEYAIWFATFEPIREKMTENESATLEIRIICKHALTGLGNVTRKKYSCRDIKAGMYASGNSFEIV